jgi:hypothetical protein
MKKVFTVWPLTGVIQRGSILSLVLWGLYGCGSGQNVVPSAATGRQALEVALNAWQESKPVGKIEAEPPVQVVDSDWQNKKKLQSYEILSEETGKDGLPWFSVRLHLNNPQADKEVRYVVKGGDLLWVYREDDYGRSASWKGIQKDTKKK